MFSTAIISLVRQNVVLCGNGLTLSQKCGPFQTDRVCRRQFEIDKNGRKFSIRVENTVRKGEIARYEQFLLFPQCFQNFILQTRKNQGLFGKGLIGFPQGKGVKCILEMHYTKPIIACKYRTILS